MHTGFLKSPTAQTIWACLLAFGWLLPNHYRPWLSFHADAWVALVLLLTFVCLVYQTPGDIIWSRLAVVAGLVVCVPLVQFAAGLVVQAGVAWICFSYLLGLLLSLLLGSHWEKHCPGQPLNCLFLAIGVAAFVSVGLQLPQWLNLDDTSVFTFGGGAGRPFANLGQPNQLATLLLWGIVSVGWFFTQRRIGGVVATLLVAYLLLGVALTGSRTAVLGICALVLMSWVWRRLWIGQRLLPWVACALVVYFALVSCSIPWVNHLLNPSMGAELVGVANRGGGELRPTAWGALWDAAWRGPWWGYGWGQISTAYLSVIPEHPGLRGVVFSYSHNLFLDLVLWCGIPLGVTLGLILLAWFWRRMRKVSMASDALAVLLVIVVSIHAMLELPLCFGYLLFPFGLVLGVMDVRLGGAQVWRMARGGGVAVLLSACILFGLVARDYARVEPSFQLLRMEWMHFKISLPKEPPEVLMLTQWHDYIAYARVQPSYGMSDKDLEGLRTVARMHPSSIFFYKLIGALALNGLPTEARHWQTTMCSVVPLHECVDAKKMWEFQGLKYPEIAAIAWPTEPGSNP